MLSRCGSRLITAEAIAACIPFYRDYTFNKLRRSQERQVAGASFRVRRSDPVLSSLEAFSQPMLISIPVNTADILDQFPASDFFHGLRSDLRCIK
ncbi:uncharacterized protein PGTG_14856 [Puccinia graminis f. sp. tritici CRL 75-36-700-3]|uniref:Uncharacterized protein n=1 Tax=Puccinia graminis f. sp. tritici (strain CRL 75-36-700-3 / race SCCL) TaxID=418459 RepID=E3KWH6_PUCGT|nr:uncharacterized protein PGTG_14856 [Puccinia graminis f. sp. tritici CRL 75-36-700-3]EFP88651.2 hypothetical protein PGTG_14856 [Puccinia graminis f. sp. tritici CRL 75-36-700-3]